MNALRKSLLPLLLLGAMFTQSCKEDSTGPGSNGSPVTNTKPANGSTYTFDRVETKGSTNVGTTTNVYTVQSGASFAGKTDVYLYSSSIHDSLNKYLAFESNGNISVPAPSFDITAGSADVKWMTLPVTGAGGTSGLVIFNGEIDFIFFKANVNITSSASYAGEESFTISGTSYKAKKLKTTSNISIDMGAGPITTTSEEYHYWVPELGFFARTQKGGGKDPDTNEDISLFVETMTQFDLK